MKRTEWLIRLEQELTRLRVPNPREIVADYEEHFSAAASQGKPEEDVSAKLGDPSAAARAHQAEGLLTQATSNSSAPKMREVLPVTLRLLVLTPFNFFMLIGPFLAVAICLFVGWSCCLAFSGVSVALMGAAAIALPFIFVSFWGAGALIFGSLAFVATTVFGTLTMFLITQVLLRMFVSYMRWNIDFVLQKK